MASANTSPSKEKLLCSICLEVLTKPVTTPCGHINCKSCITNYSALSGVSQCPQCNENFHKAPELQVNTEIRDTSDDSNSPAMPGEVTCDLCHGVKRKALKSCLVCLASYCNVHLGPHHKVQALKWHKLINPVDTLEDRVCKKHNKVIEFFCRKDQSCVCVACLRDDHMAHEAISLEEEFTERKTKLKHKKRQVKHTLHAKSIIANRLQKSMVQDRQEVERTKAEIVKTFAALEASIQTKKVMLILLLEEKQKAAEQQADALIRQLQLEIAENNRTSAQLDELLTAEDEFRLLQDLPSAASPSNTKHRFIVRVQPLLEVEMVRSAVAKMEETLDEQMENIIREVNLVDEEEIVEEEMLTQTKNAFDDELGKIQEQYAVTVTLDANTAHPSLILSEDGKQVRDGGTKRNVPDNPTRFQFLHFVLGNEGFSSGRFYYEVALERQTGWEVGVARESIGRKVADLSLSPENGCWTLRSYFGRCQANTNPPVHLSLSEQPQKVGVFVDYEEGLVSFYNVDTRALIYSFTGCAFTESAPFLRNLFALRYYTSTPTKTRIYPLFRAAEEGIDSAPLQITPVKCTKVE